MCQLDREVLHRYIDDELEPHEQFILAEHLKVCPACRRELNQLKVLDWDLSHINVDIPIELEQLRKVSIDTYVRQGQSRTTRLAGVVALQKQTLGKSVAFLRYMPASRFLRTARASIAERTGGLVRKKLSHGFLGKAIGMWVG